MKANSETDFASVVNLIACSKEDTRIRNLLIYLLFMAAVVLLAGWLSYDEPAPAPAPLPERDIIAV